MTTNIEPTAVIEPGAIIGEDCYIGHFAVIRPGAIIGDHSHVRAHCFIAAEARVGNYVQVMQFSNICRNCVIEDKVFVGMGCMTTNTKKIAYLRDYEDINEPPRICYGARIGAGVTILPGVTIGENAVVGAGSVVTKNVNKRCVYLGSPAKFITWVRPEELI
jgi:acetyltransferase-like isoleucine patch superfamily enzyme